MNIAVVCRPVVYEKMIAGLKGIEDIKLSAPLHQWIDVMAYVSQNSVKGVLLDSSIVFFEQMRSLPIPCLTFEGQQLGFAEKSKNWFTALSIDVSKNNNAIQSHYEADQEVFEEEPEPEFAPLSVSNSVKVITISKRAEVLSAVQALPGVQWIKALPFQAALDKGFTKDADVILFEEEVLSKEKTTGRELKILQLVQEYKDSDQRLVLLLNERINPEFLERLLAQGFYNFYSRNHLTVSDIERIVKVPFTLNEVSSSVRELKQVIEQVVEESLKTNKPVEEDTNDKRKAIEVKHDTPDYNAASLIVEKDEMAEQLIQERTEVSEKIVDDTEKLNGNSTFEPIEESKIEVKEKNKYKNAIPKIQNLTKINFFKKASKEPVQTNVQESSPKEESSPLVQEDQLSDSTLSDHSVKKSRSRTRSNETATPAFEHPMPHRILIYSPKGGAGATTIATNLTKTATNRSVGLVEISYSYGQLAGKLELEPKYNVMDIEEGLEEYAICKEDYLCSPWVFPVKKNFNEGLMLEWLNKAQRAFPGRTLLADLQSQSNPILLLKGHEWATRSIWVIQDTPEHLGMADLQLKHMQRMGSEWRKIGIIVQEVTKRKFPWEETLEVPVIAKLPVRVESSEWNAALQKGISQHLGLAQRR